MSKQNRQIKRQASPGGEAGGRERNEREPLTHDSTLPALINQPADLAELFGVAVSLPAFSTVAETAADLYARGLNVIPLPRPGDVRIVSPEDADKKPPFILNPFFTARLHVCGPECERRAVLTGRECLPAGADLYSLFDRANVGAMVGRTSGNLVQIDCDTLPAFRGMLAEFKRRSLLFWALNSSRGGSLLFCLAEGEAANVEHLAGFPGVAISGRLGYLVLPPSVHPTGILYTWLTADPLTLPAGETLPVLSLQALEWLGVTLAKHSGGNWEEPELYGLPAWTGALSRENRRILVNPAWEGERNTTLTKPLYDIAALIDRGGVSYAEGLAVLETAADRCIPPFPRAELVSMLRSALKRHPEPARKSGRRTAALPHELALSWAAEHAWTGRTAQVDRAVFLACCERARCDGRSTFRASIREVAELANCTHKTACAALRRLISAGMLRRVTSDNMSGAGVYTFCEAVLSGEPDNPQKDRANLPHHIQQGVVSGVNKHGPRSTSEQDVFGVLGRVAWYVWSHLCRQYEPTGAAIARAVGCNPSSVSRALKRLTAEGLATWGAAEHLWYGEPLTEGQLETVSARLGSLGRSAKRKRQHEHERARRVNLAVFRARVWWHERVINRGVTHG